MKLFYRHLGGSGRPILILHGLFGSSKNWITNGKSLMDTGNIYLLDQRNHGESPHSEDHKLDDMVQDLKEFISDHSLEKPILIGHSMGGLVVSILALLYPELVEKIIVIDISPRSYELKYDKEFSALSLDVSQFSSRSDIDQEMAKFVPDIFIRQFLQMNLERTENSYRWKINISAIKKSREALEVHIPEGVSQRIDSLFILGKKSEYIQDSDPAKILSYFPNGKIEWVEDGDHYLHYKKSNEFINLVKQFLTIS